MRRPWNIINVPIYSLATYPAQGVNMNICTYVAVISMKPKLYSIAIDYQTQTYQNLQKTNEVVLQLLSHDSIKLVKTLGKKSGTHYDKQAYLEKKKSLSEWHGFKIIDNACSYLKLDKLEEIDTKTDHALFTFELKKYLVKSEDNILMFQDLIDQKIIL